MSSVFLNSQRGPRVIAVYKGKLSNFDLSVCCPVSRRGGYHPPVIEFWFIGVLRQRHKVQIPRKSVGTDVLGGPKTKGTCYQNVVPLAPMISARSFSDRRGRRSLQVCGWFFAKCLCHNTPINPNLPFKKHHKPSCEGRNHFASYNPSASASLGTSLCTREALKKCLCRWWSM